MSRALNMAVSGCAPLYNRRLREVTWSLRNSGLKSIKKYFFTVSSDTGSLQAVSEQAKGNYSPNVDS